CALPLRQGALPQWSDIRGETGVDGGHQAGPGIRRRLLPARALLPEDRRKAACKRHFREVRRNKEKPGAVTLWCAAVVNMKANNGDRPCFHRRALLISFRVFTAVVYPLFLQPFSEMITDPTKREPYVTRFVQRSNQKNCGAVFGLACFRNRLCARRTRRPERHCH